MDDALAYAEKHGVEEGSKYPYTGVAGTCDANQSLSWIKPLSYFEVRRTDEGLKRALATIGPVSIALDATDAFMSYDGSSPIFNDNTCDPEQPDHALLLVGYNDNQKYWIVKNSWNTDWGLHGYIYINSTQPNICGISGYATIPLILPTTTDELSQRVRLMAQATSTPAQSLTVETVTRYLLA